MTDDQHRVAQRTKAELLIADALERQGTDPRDPDTVAAWVLEQLQGYGWRPPIDPTDVPALRPEHPSVDGPGYAAWQAARAELAARKAGR